MAKKKRATLELGLTGDQLAALRPLIKSSGELKVAGTIKGDKLEVSFLACNAAFLACNSPFAKNLISKVGKRS